MHKFGLIGKSLIHSFSKKFFSEKFKNESIDAIYELYSLADLSNFKEFILQHSLSGLNVTIPYKTAILPLLDDIDEEAREIGAVNVIKINQKQNNLFLKGYNTDTIGFIKSLKPILKPYHTNALVLGTGGAAKAVVYSLKKLGIKTQCVSRKKTNFSITYEELNQDIINRNLLIINTTPLGTFPNTETCPNIPYQFLTEKHLLFDLVYNPELTLFLQKGLQHGSTIKNGYEMLVEQAESAWKIWNL